MNGTDSRSEADILNILKCLKGFGRFATVWLVYGYHTSVYLFGVLRRFQHCTGHITMGSWKGRGNQYIQLVKVLYCKLLTNGKQLPVFPLEVEL